MFYVLTLFTGLLVVFLFVSLYNIRDDELDLGQFLTNFDVPDKLDADLGSDDHVSYDKSKP